jgi:uncharacterized membrane protein YdbT with pleckstrin-like domain
MRYIENNLITGESVTYRANLHWIVFVKPLLGSLVFVALAALVLYIANTSAQQQASTLEWIAAGLLIVSVIPIAGAVFNRHAAEFGVTNKRVILKIGTVNSKIAEMFLNKIESVGVDQTMVGRIFGYGTIVIRCTGGSLEPFHRISAPLVFRKQIQEQIGQTLDPTSKAASNRP